MSAISTLSSIIYQTVYRRAEELGYASLSDVRNYQSDLAPEHKFVIYVGISPGNEVALSISISDKDLMFMDPKVLLSDLDDQIEAFLVAHAPKIEKGEWDLV